MVNLLLGILGSIIAWIICSEIDAWGPTVADRLLNWAVRRLPQEQQERYRAEWAAVLAVFPTSLSKIVVSLGFCRAAVQIHWELDARAARTEWVTRSLDVVLSTVLLVVLMPLLLVTAILVAVSSRGPILFRQMRVGRAGEVFACYKFRTMPHDAEQRIVRLLEEDPNAREAWENSRSLPRDPRITLVGRYLRATSLDEFPQLFNVVLGNMSLVGPRPITPNEIPYYGQHFESYKAVRPGLTGLWQLTRRKNVSYGMRGKLDREFSRRRSISLYLSVMLATIKVMLTRRKDD